MFWAEERTQPFRELGGSEGELGSIPRLHMAAHSSSITVLAEKSTPSFGLLRHCMYMMHIHTAKLMHIKF